MLPLFWFIAVFGGHHLGGEFRELFDERHLHADIRQVEHRVEQREVVERVGWVIRIARSNSVDEAGKRIEEEDHPTDADNVKHKVRAGGTFGFCAGSHGCEVGGDRGADVFTEDDRCGIFVADPSLRG